MFDLNKLQQMQKEMMSQMDKMQADLEKKRCEGTAGGGMVKIVLDGNQKCVEVKIQKEAVDPDDVEMVEDLVMAAINAAVEKSQEVKESGMSQITGGLKIPGLM